MFKYLTIAIFLTLGISGCSAQNKLSNFLPSGHVLFEKYKGDLNKDGKEDCIIITKQTDKKNIVVNRFGNKVDRNRRGIIVLFKTKNGYSLALKNPDCFSSENEDGGVYFPPELWIDIENGNLIVHYGHGRYGFWKYTFRYNKKDFELIGYYQSDNRGPITQRITSINFITKKKQIKVNTNNNAKMDGKEVFKETWTEVEINKLITLSEIKDFYKLYMSIY